MPENEHTPGPWINNNGTSIWARLKNRATVCVAKLPPEVKLPDRQANARLIAAAPDLLLACECVLEASQGPALALFDLENARHLLAAAVKKAKGGVS